MPIEVRYFSDPACHRAWSTSPHLTRLRREFADGIAVIPVMIGLARQFGPGYSDPESGIPPGSTWDFTLVQSWLEAAAGSGMPIDARIWRQSPPSGSHPACMAVVAAREQGVEAAIFVLRRLQEALFCERRPADSAGAIVSLLEEAPGPRHVLDLDRFRIDLTSTATIEGFGDDLSAVAEALPAQGKSGMPTRPAFSIAGAEAILAPPYEALRDAVLAAGAEPAGTVGPVTASPDPQSLLADHRIAPTGRLATAEVMAVTGRPRPVIEAELWRLATEWQIQPVNFPHATLWQLPT